MFWHKNQEEAIDINKIKYMPWAASHERLIHEELEKFNQAKNSLIRLDSLGGMAASAETLLWLTGFINGATSVLLKIAIGLYLYQVAKRQDLVNNFQQQLQKVYGLYRWCGKNGI